MPCKKPQNLDTEYTITVTGQMLDDLKFALEHYTNEYGPGGQRSLGPHGKVVDAKEAWLETIEKVTDHPHYMRTKAGLSMEADAHLGLVDNALFAEGMRLSETQGQHAAAGQNPSVSLEVAAAELQRAAMVSAKIDGLSYARRLINKEMFGNV